MFKVFVILLLSSSTAFAFNPDLIQARFDLAAQKYNEEEGLGEREANCWGALLNIIGLADELSYSDDAPVVGFFQSKHCKQVTPGVNGDFFVHIDGPDASYHSYYVGPDLKAWQKFDPSDYSLIKKEPHEQIISWYERLARFNYTNFQYTYYSCNEPDSSFSDVLRFYQNRDSESIESALERISVKLAQSSSDAGELLLLLHTLESLAHQSRVYNGLFNITEELKPHESIITKLLKRLISKVKVGKQDLLHSVLTFYITPEILINALERIVEIGGAKRISKTNLELTLHRIGGFTRNHKSFQLILESEAFKSFIESLTALPPASYGFLIKPFFIELTELKIQNPAFIDWLNRVIEETAHLTRLHSDRHFVYYHLYQQGHKVPLKLQAQVDEDIYWTQQFELAAGHFFPLSYAQGWEDDFN